MAFPTGWGRKCAIVIQASAVDGTSHTNFPVFLIEACLPSEIFTEARSDGGDIRFSSDSAGTTPLAREVVTFNTGTSKAELWVKVPTLSGSSDTTIYVWYGAASETEPAADSAYGKNNVWDSHLGSWLLRSGYTDSLGGSSITATGDHTFGAQTGCPLSACVSPDDANSGKYLTLPALTEGTTVTIDFWARQLAGSSSYQWEKIGTSGDYLWYPYGGVIYQDFGGSSRQSYTPYVNVEDNWHKTTWVITSSNVKAYTNGHLDATLSGVATIDFGIGTMGSGAGNGRLALADFRIQSAARSAEWISTEYNNVSSPATFAVEGTAEDAEGAPAEIDGTLAVTLPQITASLTADVDIEAALSVTLPVPTASLAADVDIAASLAATLPVPTAEFTAGATAEISASLSVTLPAPAASLSAGVVVSGTMTAPLPIVTTAMSAEVIMSAALAATLPVPTIEINTQVPEANASLDAALPVPTASVTAGVWISSSLSATLPSTQVAFSGDVDVSARLAASLPQLSVVLSGDILINATLSATLPMIRVAIYQSPVVAISRRNSALLQVGKFMNR